MTGDWLNPAHKNGDALEWFMKLCFPHYPAILHIMVSYVPYCPIKYYFNVFIIE